METNNNTNGLKGNYFEYHFDFDDIISLRNEIYGITHEQWKEIVGEYTEPYFFVITKPSDTNENKIQADFYNGFTSYGDVEFQFEILIDKDMSLETQNEGFEEIIQNNMMGNIVWDKNIDNLNEEYNLLEEARMMSESDESEEEQTDFCNNNLKTIEELENESEMTLEEALNDYYESCIRTSHTDMEECAKYFISENSLKPEEFDRIYEKLIELYDSVDNV